MSIWLAFRDAIALVTPHEDVILDGEPSPAGTLTELADAAVVSAMTAADGRVLVASSTLPYSEPTSFSVRAGAQAGPGWKLCDLATNSSVAVGDGGVARWTAAKESGSLLLLGPDTPCHSSRLKHDDVVHDRGDTPPLSTAELPPPSVGPLGEHPWRNDSANLRLVKAWDDYLRLSPLSREYAGAVSDKPPVQLTWDVGVDMPIGWKNGVACRFGNQVVVAGGLFESSSVWLAKYDSLPGFNISTRPSTAPALMYDLKLKTWTPIKSPPFVPGRTQGCCAEGTVPGAESMFIVSGGNDEIPCDSSVPNDTACEKVCCSPGCGNNPGCTVKVTCHTQPGCRPIGGNVTQLTRSASGEWTWTTLPPLPADGSRFVGVAGLVDDEWLVVTGGSNEDPGAGASHSSGKSLPGYRLRLRRSGTASGRLVPAGGWLKMAPHPLENQSSHGITLPVGGSLGRSFYLFGGQSADPSRAAAFAEITHVCDNTPHCAQFPHVDSDGGLFTPRDAYRYSVDSDEWTAIASLPQPLQGGGQQAVAIDERHRYLLLMGTSHRDSFRVGRSLWERAATRAKYYGDTIWCYDSVADKYSRVGLLLYGVGTTSWIKSEENGTMQLVAFGGEPMHGYKGNSETVVQVANVHRME